jgi:hypothetical protein
VPVSSKHVLYAAPDILLDLAWNRRTCVDKVLFLGMLVADIFFNLIRSSDIDLGRMTLSRGRGSFRAICNRESTFSVPSLLLPRQDHNLHNPLSLEKVSGFVWYDHRCLSFINTSGEQ